MCANNNVCILTVLTNYMCFCKYKESKRIWPNMRWLDDNVQTHLWRAIWPCVSGLLKFLKNKIWFCKSLLAQDNAATTEHSNSLVPAAAAVFHERPLGWDTTKMLQDCCSMCCQGRHRTRGKAPPKFGWYEGHGEKWSRNVESANLIAVTTNARSKKENFK